jgi:hypothetical protein
MSERKTGNFPADSDLGWIVSGREKRTRDMIDSVSMQIEAERVQRELSQGLEVSPAAVYVFGDEVDNRVLARVGFDPRAFHSSAIVWEGMTQADIDDQIERAWADHDYELSAECAEEEIRSDEIDPDLWHDVSDERVTTDC